MRGLFSQTRQLRLRSWGHRLRAALRRRNPAVRRAERERAQFYECAWRDAARALGAQIQPLADGLFEIEYEGLRTKVCRNYTAIDDPVTLLLAGDKPAVHRLLSAHGLPTPRFLEFSLDSFSEAIAFLAQAGGPCVVKPARDTGAGLGVTTGIKRPAELAGASAAAAAHCSELLIEEELQGSNFRLLYLRGTLLDAVERRPPNVTGDGKSTIAALVAQANAVRAARGIRAAQVLLTANADMDRTLAEQGWKLHSIPPAGTHVTLKRVINENGADDNVSAAGRICPSVIADGARAAAAVGSQLAGVDIITPDPSRPLQEVGGAIVEVNTTPGFYYHYYRLGETVPVALHVLRSIFEPQPEEAPLCLNSH